MSCRPLAIYKNLAHFLFYEDNRALIQKKKKKKKKKGERERERERERQGEKVVHRFRRRIYDRRWARICM